MRLRKKHWARPELDDCNFFIQKPCLYKGKWRELFGNGNPVFLELGCGKGSFIAVHGAEHPDINYIAVDIKDEVLVLAKRNIEEAYAEKVRSTDNIKLMVQEIGLIENMLGEKDQLDRIYINFCNPWPKDRHKKRRLTHTKQLVKYKVFLKSGAEIWFKTDDDELFTESLEYFRESGYSTTYVTYDLHTSGFEGNVRSEHEKMFTEMGMKIKFLIAKNEGM